MMGLADEIKVNRERVKNGTPKERFQYFWYYNQWIVYTVIIVVALVGYFIYTVFGQKEPALNGILLNPYSFAPVSSLNAMTDDFLEGQKIDKEKYAFTVNTSLYYSVDEDSNVDNLTASQTMITQVSSAQLDFITGDLETMVSVAYSDFFVDLSTVLSEEQFALYEPYMLYLDQAVLDVLNAEEESDVSTVNIPDCDKPETMERPVPILINVSASGYLEDFYVHTDDQIVLGCIHNAPHKELVAEYVEFLMEKKPQDSTDK